MCNFSEYDKNWFYLDKHRAMVSLGPLSETRTCPYSCAFCYVQDGFIPYAKKSVEEIVQYLVNYKDEYDIVYVSGDTDSFAEPRRKEGLELLRQISIEIDCDLLFTTRTIFSDDDYRQLHDVVDTLKMKGNNLFACVSITRLSDSVAYLEPRPIPEPVERIHELKKLHDIGAVVVLALRPFLPVVPEKDYLALLELSHDYVDIVLGETFFFVNGGKIEKRVFPNGIIEDIRNTLSKKDMDFNNNNEDWVIWESTVLEKMIQQYCDDHDIVFSMRSATAISDYYTRLSKSMAD